jgi:hypothetical protein
MTRSDDGDIKVSRREVFGLDTSRSPNSRLRKNLDIPLPHGRKLSNWVPYVNKARTSVGGFSVFVRSVLAS